MSIDVLRRSTRAVLIDGTDLLLLMRTLPGRTPCWVAVGGVVEPGDVTVEDALRRQVLEEVGAQIENVAQMLIIQDARGNGIQHVFLATLAPAGLVDRMAAEFGILSCGGYERVHVPFTAGGVAEIDLKPTLLADYLGSTCDALRASLGYPIVNAVPPAEIETPMHPLITEC